MPYWVTAVSRGQTVASLSTICKHCLQIVLKHPQRFSGTGLPFRVGTL